MKVTAAKQNSHEVKSILKKLFCFIISALKLIDKCKIIKANSDMRMSITKQIYH